jgi:hypothetical protein
MRKALITLGIYVVPRSGGELELDGAGMDNVDGAALEVMPVL